MTPDMSAAGTTSKSTKHELIFHCEAGSEVGMGHLSRSVELHRLAGSCGLRSSLIVQSNGAEDLAASLPTDAVWCKFASEALAFADEVLRGTDRPVAIIVDTPSRRIRPGKFSPRPSAPLVVLLNATCSTADTADLAFVRETSYCENAPSALAGWCYEVVRKEVYDLRTSSFRPRTSIRNLLATFGGSDPGRLSEHLVAQVGRSRAAHPAITLVLGRAMAVERAESLQSMAEALNSLTVVIDPPDFSQRLANADAVLTPGGQTLIEAMLVGVPILGVVWEHLTPNVERAALEGLITHVGTIDEMLLGVLEATSDVSAMNQRATRAWSTVDGLGAKRCLEAIIARLKLVP